MALRINLFISLCIVRSVPRFVSRFLKEITQNAETHRQLRDTRALSINLINFNFMFIANTQLVFCLKVN